ncbi:MAG: hypothetical protein AAGA42_12625 [Actinomycetota bacterium]
MGSSYSGGAALALVAAGALVLLTPLAGVATAPDDPADTDTSAGEELLGVAQEIDREWRLFALEVFGTPEEQLDQIYADIEEGLFDPFQLGPPTPTALWPDASTTWALELEPARTFAEMEAGLAAPSGLTTTSFEPEALQGQEYGGLIVQAVAFNQSPRPADGSAPPVAQFSTLLRQPGASPLDAEGLDGATAEFASFYEPAAFVESSFGPAFARGVNGEGGRAASPVLFTSGLRGNVMFTIVPVAGIGEGLEAAFRIVSPNGPPPAEPQWEQPKLGDELLPAFELLGEGLESPATTTSTSSTSTSTTSTTVSAPPSTSDGAESADETGDSVGAAATTGDSAAAASSEDDASSGETEPADGEADDGATGDDDSSSAAPVVIGVGAAVGAAAVGGGLLMRRRKGNGGRAGATGHCGAQRQARDAARDRLDDVRRRRASIETDRDRATQERLDALDAFNTLDGLIERDEFVADEKERVERLDRTLRERFEERMRSDHGATSETYQEAMADADTPSARQYLRDEFYAQREKAQRRLANAVDAEKAAVRLLDDITAAERAAEEQLADAERRLADCLATNEQ